MTLRKTSLAIIGSILCAATVAARAPLVHDLQLTASPATLTVATGGLVTFTLTPLNAGTASAGPGTVKVTDIIPSGFTFVQATGAGWTCAPPNATCTNTGNVAGNAAFGVLTIKANATTAGTYSNFCAHVAYAGATVDQAPANNNPACATVIVQAQGHDLKMTMTIGGGPINVGDVVDFTLSPYNLGPGAVQAAEATVSFPVPSGFTVAQVTSPSVWLSCTTTSPITCHNSGTPTPGNSPFPQITARLRALTQGQYLATCASIAYSGAPADTNHNNDQSCLNLVVLPALAHDVQITVTQGIPGSPRVGWGLVFDLAASNVGPGSVGYRGVTVSGQLPAGFSPNTVPILFYWDCAASTGTSFSCDYIGPAVAAGAPFGQFQFATTVHTAGPFSFCADIHYNGLSPDTHPANNHSCVAGTVRPVPQAYGQQFPSNPIRH